MKGNNKNLDRYDDIIDLPQHEPKFHPRMSILNRAAQFSPFAALTGYDDVILESARLTDKRIELDESVKTILDNKLNTLQENINNEPKLTVTYFQEDEIKEGGAYVTMSGAMKKIDYYERTLLMQDGTRIRIDDIINIEIGDGDIL